MSSLTLRVDVSLPSKRGLLTDPARSDLMKRVRQSGTEIELIVAKLLTSEGLHYRKNVRKLPGSPDFANQRHRWVIFVNGCFWHHHKKCTAGKVPIRNSAFWAAKFAANRVRDAKNLRILRGNSYRVAIVWQCMDRLQMLEKIRRICHRSGVSTPSPQ